MKDIFKGMRLIGKVSPSIYLLILLNGIVSSVVPYLAAVFSGFVLDRVMAGSPMDSIMVQVGIYAGVTAFTGLLAAFLSRYALSRFQTLQFVLDLKISQKSLSLPYGTLMEPKVKAMLDQAHQLTNAFGSIATYCQALQEGVTGSIGVVYAALIVFGQVFVLPSSFAPDPNVIGTWYYAFLSSPWSNLILLAVVAIATAGYVIGNKMTNGMWDKAMDIIVDGNREFAALYDCVMNGEKAKDIRIYGMEKEILAKRESSDKAIMRFSDYLRSYNPKPLAVTILPNALVLVGSFLFFGFKAWFGIVSVGTVIMAASSISSFSQSLGTLLDGFSTARTSSKSLVRYLAYLSLPTEEATGEGIEGVQAPFVFAFDHVWFKYPNGTDYALSDVSFVLDGTKRTAIVGRNGAGKSTIVKLLTRFYKPNKGRILLNGVDIQTYRFPDYQKLVAAVFQDFKLFAFSVNENVTGTKPVDPVKRDQALKIAGVYDRIQRLPLKGDTPIGTELSKDGVLFSGGESQKIAIARALYKDSPLICLDEPTSALDPLAEQEIYHSIDSLVKDKSSVFISHRMSSTRFCDRILVIDHGKVAEDGNHDSLMAIPDGIYKTMFEAQAQYYK